MDYLIPKELAERALANAKASRDFEERYLSELREQLDRHRDALDRYRHDVQELTRIVKEAEA